ncbi:MAG: porin family protein [Hyphomonadaceae bacterium]|nr:porin family protein [Hyphomonadaceae bacterium]
MRIFLAVAALAAMIGIAQPAQARDWSVYGGLEGGYGWNQSDAVVGAAARDIDTDGFTGGVFAGVETQVSGPWSLGVEGDWKYTDGDDTVAGYNLEQNWTASVRGRVAYEVTPALDIYGTVGWGWTDVEAQNGAGASDSDTLSGWSAGVGAQYAYGEHLFSRVEYRYTDYDDGNFSTVPASRADLSSHEVLVGVGWKF